MDLKMLLDRSNPVFMTFVYYGCVLVLKVLLMPLLTIRFRIIKKIFISPEDAETTIVKGARVAHDDPDIERVRRAHLNDLENIPVFFVASFFYVLTDPNVFIAVNLFRIYTLARIIHTFVYAIYVIPQPARAISWGVGYFITIFMAISALISFIGGI